MIAEGKTEQRVLPALYEAVSKNSLAQDRTAILDIQGSGSVAPCMAVFRDLGIPARAVVDIDYIVRNAANAGVVDVNDPDLAACLQQIHDMAEVDSTIELDWAGRPKNCSGGKRAAEVYIEWAQRPDSQAAVAALHEKCKAHGLWLWPRGDIEHHLGLAGAKDESEWASFVERLSSEGVAGAVADWETVEEFVGWLRS